MSLILYKQSKSKDRRLEFSSAPCFVGRVDILLLLFCVLCCAIGSIHILEFKLDPIRAEAAADLALFLRILF